jgi:hypothetical protein
VFAKPSHPGDRKSVFEKLAIGKWVFGNAGAFGLLTKE